MGHFEYDNSEFPVDLSALFAHYKIDKNLYILSDVSDENIHLAIKVNVFIHKLFSLRKEIYHNGISSQNENFKEHIKLNNFVIKHCKEKLKQKGEEDE